MVKAAVRVVFPWSTWPMVPMLTWGFLRSNFPRAARTMKERRGVVVVATAALEVVAKEERKEEERRAGVNLVRKVVFVGREFDGEAYGCVSFGDVEATVAAAEAEIAIIV